jgi:thymidylate synthase
LGELIWYLSGSNSLEFIAHYIPQYRSESEDGNTVYGAYGPRLIGDQNGNQIRRIIELLKQKPTTRRAVIQLFDHSDLLRDYKEIPCTISLQFLVRDGRLDLIVNMRSNDAFKGLPHDVFCFTMIQEIVSRSVGTELGIYRHFIGSLHYYDDTDELRNDTERLRSYIGEGYQNPIEMPPMPVGDPWAEIARLIVSENNIRQMLEFDINDHHLDGYWKDLVRLLQAYAWRNDVAKVQTILNQFEFSKYKLYLSTLIAKQMID